MSCWRHDLSSMSCLVSLCLSFGGCRRHVATHTWSTKMKAVSLYLGASGGEESHGSINF
jgi:hypothetical protein